jgi:hypothetical protein
LRHPQHFVENNITHPAFVEVLMALFFSILGNEVEPIGLEFRKRIPDFAFAYALLQVIPFLYISSVRISTQIMIALSLLLAL